MQIIIPMSGTGERFRKAGYDKPKPLIEVEGKPIIAHVIGLFAGETDFLFICNNDHLSDGSLQMAETLRRFCPSAKIVGIDPHKEGPVNALLKVSDQINLRKPTLVSYCDYGAVWDYAAFKSKMIQTQCDGAVIGYTGFHPHMLRQHRYGYVRMDGERVADIREKESYSDRPMNEIALCGAYYFRDGETMLESLKDLSKRNELKIAGEHYVSLAYKALLARHADIRVFLLEHFMQWGTPEDLRDYFYYSALCRAEERPQVRAKHSGAVVVPMAGQGKRFADAGYKDPKPLIPIAGTPMAVKAFADLPDTPEKRCVLRRDLPECDRLTKELPKHIRNIEIIMIDTLTEGQALTARAALEGVPDDTSVTFGACDNGMRYDARAFERLFIDTKNDVIVWGARGWPPAGRNPNAFGWIDADPAGRIRSISVKTPLSDPASDPIVTGTFTFRRAGDFRRAVAHMLERNARVNGEFYIDTVINDALALGLTARLFQIDFYLGWGTPDELRTYLYWKDCFKKRL